MADTVYSITERDLMFEVSVVSGETVHPTIAYPTKELAAARLLQMMEINGPITPQRWAEDVQIGTLKIRDGEEDDR